jgi:basic amino acid/polyamine antiporter, APA family
VLLLTSVFFLVNVCVLVLRGDPVAHSHFVAPAILRSSGPWWRWCSCCPSTGRPRSTGSPSSCCWAAWPWGINFLVTRRTGTVVAEEDLTTGSDR